MQKLKDFCMHITDGEHGSVVDDLKGNYYLLSNKNIVDGNIEISKDDRKINYQIFSKINNRLRLQKDSIAISTVGSVGKVAILQDNINFVFQRSVGIINVDKTKLNPYYLLGLLESKPYQTYLNNVATGSIQKCVFISDLENIPILYKPIKIQNEIGKKLQSIYIKIDNNKSIINHLTNKIKDIYTYWFIENHAENKFNNGNPFEMVSLTNNKLCSLIPTGINKFEGHKDYFSTSEVKGNSYQSAFKFITYFNRESRANMEPRQLSVWFAKMKNSIKHISFGNNSYLQNKIILSTGFAGLECTNISFAYIWSLINANSWFERTKDNIATGSTQESINENGLSYIKIKCPNYKSLEKYSAIVSPYIDMIEKLNEENEKLKSIKQTLLSYLITQ